MSKYIHVGTNVILKKNEITSIVLKESTLIFTLRNNTTTLTSCFFEEEDAKETYEKLIKKLKLK